MSTLRLKFWRTALLLTTIAIFLLAAAVSSPAQTPVTSDPPFYGPFNGLFLVDGDGLQKKLTEHDSVLRAESPWSLYCWIRTEETPNAQQLVAGIGDPNEEYPRYLGLDAGKVTLWLGKDNSLEATANLAPAQWHLLAATFDANEFHLYSDGQQVASGNLALGSVSAVLQMAPPILAWTNGQHFGGKIVDLTLLREALSA